MNDREHWNRIYTAREDSALTWFEAEATLSLSFIRQHAVPGDPIIDVGGGASRLVDGLLDAGLGPASVLDLSDTALDLSRKRLGERAEQVTWLAEDVTRWRPVHRYGIWHDRAVLHFLTDPTDRAAYVSAMTAALRPGGHAILSTFDLEGPDSCAGLPVQRYSPETLDALLSNLAPERFLHVTSTRHVHNTPLGNKQEFQVSVFQRLASSSR